MEQVLNAYRSFFEGDKESFSEVVRVYGDALTRFACSFLKDYASAEDVMMDVFASLLVTKRVFYTESMFKTYIFKCARNNCVDRLRKQRKLVPLEYAENKCVDDMFTQEAVAIDRDERVRVSIAIKDLPEQYRQVIHLIYYEGFDITETALILNKSKKQIYNLLARSKQSIKAAMAKYC